MNDLAAAKPRLTLDQPKLDVAALRRQFPVYENNPGLVFLDSGASAQKPACVIDGVAEFYRRDYANVHRGVYSLSQRSTDHFEEARERWLVEAEHLSDVGNHVRIEASGTAIGRGTAELRRAGTEAG